MTPQPANVCSNVPFKNGITLDWTMEESPATCSTLQFTPDWFSMIRFISISLCWVNCLVVWCCVFIFAGKVPIWFNLRFHVGQLCNWMKTGLESDLNTLRKQFEPKLMLVLNGSPLPVFFVLGILMFLVVTCDMTLSYYVFIAVHICSAVEALKQYIV